VERTVPEFFKRFTMVPDVESTKGRVSPPIGARREYIRPWKSWAEQCCGLAMSVIFTLSLMINVAIGFGHGLPVPRVHDEFSYLLASDTFASGRLTNPPHPMWKHFETMHVIQQPTYASKYPPGPGLVMAVGQRFLHEPIFAVWLCTALACALICWMLAAWMPVPWAFLGGVLAALHPVVVFWSQNYYGGSLSLLGGALVLGAFRRILDRR
jgi:hypothetical protein